MGIRELATSSSLPFDLNRLGAWGQTPAFVPTPQAVPFAWPTPVDVLGGVDPGLAQGRDLLRAFVGAQGQPGVGMPMDVRQMLQSLNASDGRVMSNGGCCGSPAAAQGMLEMQLQMLLGLLIEYLANYLQQNGMQGRDLGNLGGGKQGGAGGGGGGTGGTGGASGGNAGSPSATTGASNVTPPGTANAGEGVERWRPMVREYAAKHGIPEGQMAHFENFVLTMMKVESGGNPNAIGDNGHSVGLFQMHDQGAGHGMSVEQRKDPRVQFETMMPKFVAAYRSGRAQGLDGAQLAIHIAREAERPAASMLPKYGRAYEEMFG
ncbi:transglycosylase SLT domain-containing protein [Myxococcota bacterium]|nr:transglycosylase SLT domain-containing protein [Myxococcota bacterium]